MSIAKKELYRSAKGPVMNNEDRWYLGRDTESGDVFIVHEWEHLDVRDIKAKPIAGSTHIEIGAFLAQGGPAPAHRELLRLIGTLVEGS
jgi:hypothetical protein